MGCLHLEPDVYVLQLRSLYTENPCQRILLQAEGLKNKDAILYKSLER